MMNVRISVLHLFFTVLILATAAVPVQAADVPLEFDNPALQKRYDTLLHQLRCLVCQNETLAVSQADLAQDLRGEIYRMMADGRTNREITDYLVARYGDFVLYDPPLQSSTWLLWFGPFLLLIIALTIMARFILSRRTVDGETEPQDRERLQHLLQEPDKEE
jgi:cytochrome c-type biogenesis protein CcmH